MPFFATEPDEETSATSVNPPAPPTELPIGMGTDQGADDDPPLSIAEKRDGEPVLDPDGDGTLSVDEANVLLGGEQGTTGESDTDNGAG